MPVEATDRGCRVHVYAQPRASRTEVVGPHGDLLKIRVAAPPVGGAANEALRRFLAGRLEVALARVTLVRGAGGRRKVFDVDALSADLARRRLRP